MGNKHLKKKLQGGLPLNHITMVQTYDEGTVIVRGNTDSSADFIVTKLNKGGAEKWSKKYEIPGTVSVMSIAADTKDNGFALLLKMPSNTDIGVLKCDSLGNIAWERKIAVKNRMLSWGFSNTQTALITNTKDGGFFIAAVPNPYGENDDLTRIILIRLDKKGDKLWNTSHEVKVSFGYYNSDFALDAISETPDNGVIIAERYAACDFYCYNTFIYGFDKDGKNNLSRLIYGESSTLDNFKYLTVTQISKKNDNLEVIGDVNNWQAPYSQKAYFRLKQNPETTVYLLQDNVFALSDFLKKKTSSAFWGKNLMQVKTTSLFRNDGSVFTAGTTWNQYDTQGKICPDYLGQVIDTVFTKTKDLLQSADSLTEKHDSIIASDFSVSVINIPASVKTVCEGTAPGLVAAVSATNIKVVDTKKQLVYPNPAKDILHIQVSGKATFSLINQAGKNLITTVINNKGEMNIASLPAGLYYLKNNTTGAMQKVIVSK